MAEPHASVEPVLSTSGLRRRLNLKHEFVLALLPTLTVLLVFALVEVLSQQRLLFASLASSAFLIYLDPHHSMNTVRALVLSHLLAAAVGFAMFVVFSSEYPAVACAMVITIGLMILLDVVHPPAVSTALSFAARAENEQNLMLFILALGIIALLVVIERATLRLLARRSK